MAAPGVSPGQPKILLYGQSAFAFLKAKSQSFVLPDDYQACVYKIENKINGKCYVGHTAKLNPYMRWYEHVRELELKKHLSPYLQHSWDKYGFEAFEFVIIEFCSLEKRQDREQHWIDRLKSEYNISRFVNRTTLGTKRSKLQNERKSAMMKLLWKDPEYRKKTTEAIKAAMLARLVPCLGEK